MKNFHTVNKTEILKDCKALRTGHMASAVIGNCFVGVKSEFAGVQVTYESRTYYLKAYKLSERTFLSVRGFNSAKALADFVRANQR